MQSDLPDKFVNPDMHQSLFAVTKSSSAVIERKIPEMITKHKVVYIASVNIASTLFY